MSALCLRLMQAAVAFAGAAAALIIPLPSSCAAPAPLPPPVQRRTLPSGLRVIVAEQAGTTLAALDLRVRAGSGSETGATNGTAHFIEHLLFKGTSSRKPGEIDQAIEAMGGELKAQTTRDATRLATVLPAAKWQDALALIADMTLHPAFRAGDVSAEKPVILSEMAIARTEPMRAGFNALATTTFDSHDSYRFPLMGSEASVKAMTSEALRAFWQQWYRPQNMTLVIAGNVKAAEVFEAAERLFPSVPLAGFGDREPSHSKTPPSSISGVQTIISEAGGDNLTTIFLGFRAPSGGEADATATVMALVSLLAERADQGTGEGRLPDALITRQRLALSVTADYAAQQGSSMVVISVTCIPSNAAKLENALMAELRKLPGNGFTAEDAMQARQNLLRAQASDGSVEGTAARLALADVLSLPPEETDDPSQQAAHLLRVVTPESLTAAARQYLSPEDGVIVVIHPPVVP